MTMKYDYYEQEHIRSKKTIGYWSVMGGVEMKEVEHGINDYVICTANSWYGHPTCHRLRVRYCNERAYVLLDNTRLYLDECIRA